MEKSVPLKEELNVIHSPLRHRVVAYYAEPCSTRVGPEAEAGARESVDHSHHWGF